MAGTQGKVAVAAAILLMMGIMGLTLVALLPGDRGATAGDAETLPGARATSPDDLLAPDTSVPWISLTQPLAPPIRGEGYVGPMRVQPTGSDYAVGNGLAAGVRPYTDRRYRLLAIPEKYQGLAYIQMRQDDKMAMEGYSITFDVASPVIVYIARDDRLPNIPEWMQDYVDTGDEVSTDDEKRPTYSIYGRPFPKGKITLGPNHATTINSCMYMVFVKQLEQKEYENLAAAHQPTSRPDRTELPELLKGLRRVFE